MFFQFFARSHLPRQTINYAIGDIHGMSNLFDDLWRQIGDHASAHDAIPVPIFLGDLIDRGPDNVEVLDKVHEILSSHPGSRLILGNHDEFFLNFLTGRLDQKHRDLWLTYGGLATARSYGIDPDADEAIQAERIKADYPHHFALLSEASSHVDLERFFLVHAGVRPGIPFKNQDPQDLRWIREPFLSATELFEKTVVHGHTITASSEPEVFQNRIAIDTGAFHNNRLTAMAIFEKPAPDGPEYEFISAES